MRIGKHQSLRDLGKAVARFADEALCLLHLHFVEVLREGHAAQCRKASARLKKAKFFQKYFEKGIDKQETVW